MDLDERLISIPSIYSDFDGYNYFSLLAAEILCCCDKRILFDFSNCRFFAANMTSPLGIILKKLDHYGNEFQFVNFEASVKDILERNKFFNSEKNASVTDPKRTVIPYKTFTLFQRIEFAQYIKNSIEDNDNISSNIPKMSDPLKERFHSSINELYNNSCIHSCSDEFGVSASGQFFPKSKKIAFTICDLGIGFVESIRRSHDKILEPIQALEWAVSEKYSTTRKVVDNIPGSLGLKLLKEFIVLNKGKFEIISNSGYWLLDNGNVTTYSLHNSFPGTIVTLEIRTDDKNSYILTAENKDEDDFYFS